MTEKEIIKGCLKDKEASQRALYDRYAGKMYMICLRYAKSREEAEDILQEGFVAIFDNIKKFRSEGSFEGWMRRIMVNTALKTYHKQRFHNEQLELSDYDTHFEDPQAVAMLSTKELLELISALPDGYRLVFNLYAIEGYSHKEIADKLGISESTSRSQLLKARKMLQRRINHQEASTACLRKII
jgi:RNA polymerase sigma-70 factor (ECF subfamily)